MHYGYDKKNEDIVSLLSKLKESEEKDQYPPELKKNRLNWLINLFRYIGQGIKIWRRKND